MLSKYNFEYQNLGTKGHLIPGPLVGYMPQVLFIKINSVLKKLKFA
jgi:hypothetical protein